MQLGLVLAIDTGGAVAWQQCEHGVHYFVSMRLKKTGSLSFLTTFSFFSSNNVACKSANISNLSKHHANVHHVLVVRYAAFDLPSDTSSAAIVSTSVFSEIRAVSFNKKEGKMNMATSSVKKQ